MASLPTISGATQPTLSSSLPKEVFQNKTYLQKKIIVEANRAARSLNMNNRIVKWLKRTKDVTEMTQDGPKCLKN